MSLFYFISKMGSIEVGAGDILSSGMGAVPIPDDKKIICIITMVATKMILQYLFMLKMKTHRCLLDNFKTGLSLAPYVYTFSHK